MRKHTASSEKVLENDCGRGTHSWLLHARYVRGEHAQCGALADDLQRRAGGAHRYAHFIKGSVLADAGRYQEALERFHSCIRLQPSDPEPLKQVAKCLFKQGRFQLSLEAYLEADKLSKYPDPDIYCALAECAWNLGEAERGVEWARAGVRAGGGERGAALLARLLQACGDVGGALAAYDVALTAHACGADTLAAAGVLQLRAGDPRRAFQLLGAALALQPRQHAAALALAAMMLRHKDQDAALTRLKALTCLQRAAWAAPLSGAVAHALGLALLAARRPASAFCRLAAAAALHPAHPHTVLLIAVALERLGDSRAEAAYERAASLAPDDALARLNLAGRRARSGAAGAAAEAAVAAKLLAERPVPQLIGALATLVGLLRDAGVELPDTDALPSALESEPGAEVDTNSPEEEQLASDVSLFGI